ncbi:GPP34 family phosphoprotein [Streptomyces sp. NPDC048825]|uniref:GOLPH3/VPS74 family protein n=1 Tax=Streptomyces sp. NPDC048825 TaxID=3365592 RepID=UPI00371B75DD
MTTPRDLLIIAMDLAASRTLERGDLSLALAGAELLDLLDAQAITLAGDHIVPSDRHAVADRMLDEAASSLARQAPYDSVDDWLWRRGRDLSAAYLAALEAEGQLSRQRHRRWLIFQPTHLVLVDSPARRHAANRYASDEPILAALAAAVGIGDNVGIGDKPTGESPSVADDAVATVLAAVLDAVRGLEAERQRRALDEAAFDNIWRGE